MRLVQFSWINFAAGLDVDAVESGQIVVTSPLDESDGDYSLGDLTLREAIEMADTMAGDQEIVFANNALGMITLDSEIVIDSAVEILGPGSDLLTIDANANGRVFMVDDGTTAEIDVTISGLKLTGGDVDTGGASDHGGAIYNKEDLTLDSLEIAGNTAADHGGAIYGNTERL